MKEKGFSWEKKFLTDVPYLLLEFPHIKSPSSKESFWLSIGYILLTLEEKGLFTVTYTPSNFIKISKFINTPKNFKLEVILPIEYSHDEKTKYERKPVEEILFFEKFNRQENPAD